MPLTGIKILDMTRVVSGPFCTMMLADFGADVIKIEAHGGDPTRVTGITKPGMENPYFVNLNRNKRSMVLNLKTEKGKEIILKLAKWADVLVENFRPGVMDRLGLGYDVLKEINPGLVYGAITGFGPGGPYRDRPAFDFIAQAMSGFMSLNGSQDVDPIRVGIPISDTVAGLYAAFGILAALRVRDQTGKGQKVESAMVDGLMSMFTFASAAYFATGELPPRNGNDHMVVSPYGLFKASDGPLAIAPSTEKNWVQLCGALGREDLLTDPRFDTSDKRRANRAEINEIVSGIIKTKTRDEWIGILNKAGVPSGPVNNLAQAFSDPQVIHQEMVIESQQPGGPVKMPGFPLKLSETAARLGRPSPGVGQHSREIMKEIGFTDAEITGLIEGSVLEDDSRY